MKFSRQWLDEWVDIDLSNDQLADQLTMAGLEVGSLDKVANDFSKVVVAKVLEVNPHPNADKLTVCKVDISQGEMLTIVCGAKNVRANTKFPAALIGAKLPGMEIKKTKLRGIESFGMLCSKKELGLAETSEGLFELPANAPVGENVREYLFLDDISIDVDLTPNRGDCASIAGISREVAAINKTHCHYPDIEAVDVKCRDQLPVSLEYGKACPRYVGRIIRHVNSKARSPFWLTEKLRRSGIGKINPIVDVMNYVLLELGQPMHSFDLAKLSKRIEVRLAKPLESVRLLNGSEVILDSDTLIIADSEGPVAIAGVMGNEKSSVTETTKHIFLESAFFTPITMAGKSRKYGIQTDSSYRFERGVDYQLQVKAIERATKLLVDIVGGEPGPVIEVIDNEYLPETTFITLSTAKVVKLIGVEISQNEIIDILNRLGMNITIETHDLLRAEVPSYRFDLHQDVDLIEEIARIYGYLNIPLKPYATVSHPVPISSATVPLRRFRDLLQDRGYHEVITYSFISPVNHERFGGEGELMKLSNPISSDMSIMRSSLWPGLFNIFLHNLHRHQNRVRIFETG